MKITDNWEDMVSEALKSSESTYKVDRDTRVEARKVLKDLQRIPGMAKPKVEVTNE